MDTPQLIGLCGRAGSGKSEATKALLSKGFVLVKLAGALKEMITTLYEYQGLDSDEIRDRLEGPLKEQPDQFLMGQTPRHAMQTLGTEWGRDSMRHDFWARLWRKRVMNLMNGGARVVVDDVRFPNEVSILRELGGRLLEIRRPRTASMLLGSQIHKSESFDLDPDFIITNDGSVSDLYGRVVAAAA